MPPFFLRYSEQSGREEMLPCPFFFYVFSNLKDQLIAYNYQKYLTKKKSNMLYLHVFFLRRRMYKSHL